MMKKSVNIFTAALLSFTLPSLLMAEPILINISALSGAYSINDIRQKKFSLKRWQHLYL